MKKLFCISLISFFLFFFVPCLGQNTSKVYSCDNKVLGKYGDNLFDSQIRNQEVSAPYFLDFLRRYMTLKKPVRNGYYDYTSYVLDSIAWEDDPLCGWCNKNIKLDGNHYDLFRDGLKIYTTIDSRIQHYAELACHKHVAEVLQPQFDKTKEDNRNYPFSRITTAEVVNKKLRSAQRFSERYRLMKSQGASDASIERAFNTSRRMRVFSYHGKKDTVMTPLDSIRYMKAFLQTGFVSIDPRDGWVKAYVGGLDFYHFNFDKATRSRRMIGSAVQPFLYALAMESGMTPETEVPNVQRTYTIEGGRSWTPRNGSRARYGENVSLRWAMQQSNNWVAAHLIDQLSPIQFKSILNRFGLCNPDIYPTMSLCLGPCTSSVLEMASAYCTFANDGNRIMPLFVTKIEDSNGRPISTFQPRIIKVLSNEAADNMLILLKAVVDGGTANRLRTRFGIHAQIGGKTGTTSNNRDGWFVGITPRLVSACWVGGDDGDIHFDSFTYGQGATTALPVFANFMKSLYSDISLGYSENEKLGPVFEEGF